MSKPKLAWHVAATCTILALTFWWAARLAATDASAEYPNRPIHIVVPYAAGGGSDTFVRILQQGIVEDFNRVLAMWTADVHGNSGSKERIDSLASVLKIDRGFSKKLFERCAAIQKPWRNPLFQT